MNPRILRGAAPILIVSLLLVFMLSRSIGGGPDDANTYPKLFRQIDQNRVDTIRVFPGSFRIEVTPKRDEDGGRPYTLGYASSQDLAEIYNRLESTDQLGAYRPQPVQGTSPIAYILQFVVPVAILLVGWFYIMRLMQGGGGPGGGRGVLGFGKSRARQVSPDAPKVTFSDVAGADEAVEELSEIRDFLADPRRFQALGARIPKGVLLFGPPGTGKTLLARAVAGEAGVPFFSISGSDFVEMFVGVGASRVRDLFEQAKQHSPCIVFVDEIDAVGRHRGAGLGGGNDEREQTLNQLLVEMDGFEMHDNIIVVAATNRPDILDPALLRPGRFDRQIRVDAPDRPGREEILKVHTKGKPLDTSVDLGKISGQTAGFTGADLENLVNEAALLAARRGRKKVTTPDLEEGIMRVIVGPEKKARVMTEREKRVTAVHEMGHALVAHFLEHADPVHKISIVGRGMALGYVVSMPSEDRYTQRRVELMAQLAQALGGRTAEEIVFGEYTTGAASDLKKVTETAKRMVMRWGMSEVLGPRAFGHDSSQPFLGRDFHSEPDYSDDLARQIDDEIHGIIEEAHELARSVLGEHREQLEALADVLVEHETIDSDQFERLLEGVPAAEVFAAAANDEPAGEDAAAGDEAPGAPPADQRPSGPAIPPRPELGTERYDRPDGDGPGQGPRP